MCIRAGGLGAEGVRNRRVATIGNYKQLTVYKYTNYKLYHV